MYIALSSHRQNQCTQDRPAEEIGEAEYLSDPEQRHENGGSKEEKLKDVPDREKCIHVVLLPWRLSNAKGMCVAG